MKTIEERREKIDRSKWRRGPWDDEPDFRQWQDEATGLPCLIVRSRRGNLCGYVGVSSAHPCFEKDYNDVPLEEGVHGGLTYADHCCGGICHTVEAGEDDNIWWLGFDCLHCWDIAPGFDDFESPDSSYKDIHYVACECRNLARQLAAVAGGGE